MRSDGGPAASHTARLLAALAPDVRGLFARTKALVVDCDGVLTDGRIACDTVGGESLTFHVRDSAGLWQAKKAGIRIALVTGRSPGIAESRPTLFPFDEIRTNALDKAGALRSVLSVFGVEAADAAYVGDDLLDIAALRIAGLPVAVGDCDPDLVPFAQFVTRRHGGCGAVREVTDLILEAQGRRAAILAPPTAP